MKYDDASWHERADGDKAIHIGFYVHWLVKHRLLSQWFQEEVGQESLDAVNQGKTNGYDFLVGFCDGKLVDDDMSVEGKAFTDAYYKEMYFGDLDIALPDDMKRGDMKWAPYSQDRFHRIADILDRRFDEWKRGELQKPLKPGFWRRFVNFIRPR